MKNRWFWGAAALTLATAALSACGSTKAGPDVQPNSKPEVKSIVPSDPVKLVIYSRWAWTPEDFAATFEKPVKAKYPGISFELIVNGKGQTLPDLIAAGTIPDLVIDSNATFQDLKDLKLAYDLKEQISKHKFDLNRVNSSLLDIIKTFSTTGETFFIPYAQNFNALYYNKAIFDKFGVSYPKDGMTWNDAIELGKKVSRMDGGEQYRGLDPDNIISLASQRSAAFVDPATEKASLGTADWKAAFELFREIYNIPNNKPAAEVKAIHNYDPFLKDRRLAMYPKFNLFTKLEEAAKNGLDWDMVTYPTYKDKPGVMMEGDVHLLAITANSKNKDVAFAVIDTILSDSAQLEMSKLGRLPVVKNEEVRKAFGTGLPFLKGKNVQAAFKLQPAPMRKTTPYDRPAVNLVFNANRGYFQDKDINTVIREAEEAVNKMIATEKSKSK